MAARDILTLNTDIAPRLIRIVYALALILITLAVLLGVGRGITRMVHTPQPRTAMMAGRGAMGPGRLAQNQQHQTTSQSQNQTAANAAPAAAAAPSATPAPAAPSAAPSDQAPQNGMMGPRMGMRGMHRGMMGGYMGMGRPGMRGPGMMGPRMGMRGMGGPHRFGMHRFAGHRGRPGLLGHLPPVAAGGLQIIRTLVMGAIGIMLARILAELAGSVLAMGVKARQA